ncbi:MAG: hypothetical protein HKN47_23765 [Pirellulaceae bacterium]|nr:hypothetical protein [Pirellulaceae bacterium]
MVLNPLVVSVVIAAALIIAISVFWGFLSTGLQEADDPSESRPEDLSAFEKRHTHRPDVRR